MVLLNDLLDDPLSMSGQVINTAPPGVHHHRKATAICQRNPNVVAMTAGHSYRAGLKTYGVEPDKCEDLPFALCCQLTFTYENGNANTYCTFTPQLAGHRQHHHTKKEQQRERETGDLQQGMSGPSGMFFVPPRCATANWPWLICHSVTHQCKCDAWLCNHEVTCQR